VVLGVSVRDDRRVESDMSLRVAFAVLLCLSLPRDTRSGVALAAPAVIVLAGGPQAERVVMRDWSENHRLMVSVGGTASVSLDSLRGRPRIHVGMYWGSHWQLRTDLPDSVAVSAIWPGYQSGAFYPAFRGKPALWVFGPAAIAPLSARKITPAGLRILKTRGVPVAVN
jgi:hypothetical protein